MVMEQLSRIREVVKVLSKHGLGSILYEYGFSWCVPFFKRSTPLPSDVPVRLRNALEELGGAYIKLGQMLSLRPDLIPDEFCKEFSKLLDNITSENIKEIENTIEHEFKKPAKVLFKNIDPRPLGSASIAQVHKARLPSGEAVAVKVQRLHVSEQFTKDISIMHHLAQKLEKHMTSIKPISIVQEFERYTKRELNFMTEGTNLEDLRNVKNKHVIVPKVFWSHTSEKVLTMEYLEGLKLTNAKGIQRHTAQLIVDAFLDQVFKAGIFHADLHPGNILLMKNGKIGLIDCGIIGRIDKSTQHLGFALYNAILEKKNLEIAELLLDYGVASKKTDVVEFTKQIDNLVSDWWQSPDKRITNLMYQFFILCTQHDIALPHDTLLLGKAMITAESTVKQLDPDTNFVQYSEKKLRFLLEEKKSPKKFVKDLAAGSANFVKELSILPGKAIDAIDRLEQGKINFGLKDDLFRHFGEDINKSSNRLSYALVCAALILAGAVFVDTGPVFAGYSLASSLSFVLASFFLLAMLVSIAGEKRDLH